MTPNDIEVLLHCYCVAAPHPRKDAPAVKDALLNFLEEELIEQVDDNDYYTTTERGAAHVNQLCQLSFPKWAWVNNRGEVIKD